MNLRPTFNRILKNHGLYNAFYYNLKIRPFSSRSTCKTNSEYFKKTPRVMWINSGFNWGNTRQGYRIWSEFDAYWCRVVNNTP